MKFQKLDQELAQIEIGGNKDNTQTVLRTGVITKHNRTIYLPATSATNLEIHKAIGVNTLLELDTDYTLDATKTTITFTDAFLDKTNTQLKIKATFDWNNQGINTESDRGTKGTLQWLQDQGLLLWLRDVEQLGDG